MTINEYLEATRRPLKVPGVDMIAIRPALVCADGFRVSVQASESHYCQPRSNSGPYSSIELGYPSESVPELMEYAEDADNPTGTVYGWVPVEVVDAVIAAHGGINAGAGL